MFYLLLVNDSRFQNCFRCEAQQDFRGRCTTGTLTDKIDVATKQIEQFWKWHYSAAGVSAASSFLPLASTSIAERSTGVTVSDSSFAEEIEATTSSPFT